MYAKTIKLIALIIMLSVAEANAQSITNSPYSRYGLGDISYMGSGHNVAMGGTSVAESTPYFINTVNPAANTRFLIQRFLFDVGFDVKFINTQSAASSQKNTTSTFRYLAGGFAAKPWWFFTFQLKPYSSVGYSYSDSTRVNLDGTQYAFREKYSGVGGLNKLSISTAFKFLKMFSVGATGSVLFGNLERNHSIYSVRDNGTTNGYHGSYQSNIYYNNNYIIHGVQADLGFRFEKSVRSRKDTLTQAFRISLGAYLGNKADLKSRNELLLTNYRYEPRGQYSTSSGVGYVPISQTDTIKCDTLYNDVITLPQGYGLGISMEFMEKLTINADYQYQKWSKFHLPGQESTTSMRDSKYFGLGMQFVTDRYSKNYFKTINYRVGIHNQQTYMNIAGTGIQERGITFGLGFPISTLLLNLNFDYGYRGTTEHNLYKEKYLLMHINVTAHDVWFVKRKFK